MVVEETTLQLIGFHLQKYSIFMGSNFFSLARHSAAALLLLPLQRKRERGGCVDTESRIGGLERERVVKLNCEEESQKPE